MQRRSDIFSLLSNKQSKLWYTFELLFRRWEKWEENNYLSIKCPVDEVFCRRKLVDKMSCRRNVLSTKCFSTKFCRQNASTKILSTKCFWTKVSLDERHRIPAYFIAPWTVLTLRVKAKYVLILANYHYSTHLHGDFILDSNIRLNFTTSWLLSKFLIFSLRLSCLFSWFRDIGWCDPCLLFLLSLIKIIYRIFSFKFYFQQDLFTFLE
jgi:hypothetical protein